MSSRILIAGLLLLLQFGAGGALAESIDDAPAVVAEYARGKRLLREGNYLEAARVFGQLAERNPASGNLDLFLFNRARADYHLGNQAQALSEFNDFTERYPASTYVAHARWFIGNLYCRRGQITRAVRSFVEAWGASRDNRLTSLVESSLIELLSAPEATGIGPADLASLSDERRCQLAERLGLGLESRGKVQAAREVRALCGAVSGREHGSAPRGDLEIAVVLPFSGDLQSFGEEIYQGAVVAADQFRRETGRRLVLIPHDTRGEAVDAARIVKELLGDGTDAVIGPLTSEETAVASAALSCGTLPMIAPAATQAGLTMLSESTFQLSPNIEMQGVRAAEYAAITRGASTAIIVTSTTVDHLRMAEAFANRFRVLGGQVIATEYYRPRDTDFGEQIRDIKTLLNGLQSDSTYFVSDEGDTLDIEAVPAAIDCLYLPGNAEQLRLLLPQLNYFTIRAFYVGSDGWGDETVYRLGDNVTRQAVFPSPFLEQARGESYVRFSNAFDQRYGKRPGRLAALGYDAARLLAAALAAGADDRAEIVRQLALVSGYDGASGRVTFGEFHENVDLPMYQIIDGVAVPLGDTSVAPAPPR